MEGAVKQTKLDIAVKTSKVHAMVHPFFLSALSFEDGVLTASLQRSSRLWAIVKFHLPRAFRFFNESDNFQYLQSWDGHDLLTGEEGCCISESKTASYLTSYLTGTPESRLDHGLRSILIVTPQECVEVITFEPPSIIMISEGDEAVSNNAANGGVRTSSSRPPGR